MNNTELQTRQVLIVEDLFSESSRTLHNAVMRLADALADRDIAVQYAQSVCEAFPIAATNMDLDAFLVATDMEFEKTAERRTLDFLKHVRERQAGVPVFLLADRAATSRNLSESLMTLANEFVWIFEDSPQFIAGRIEAAIQRWRATLLPPLMRARPATRAASASPSRPKARNSSISTERTCSARTPGSNAAASGPCSTTRARSRRARRSPRRRSARTGRIPWSSAPPAATAPSSRAC